MMYFKIACRNLAKQKGLSLINVSGLSIGIACFSLFARYALNIVHYWLRDFAYRISIHWWVFVLAGLLAIATALLTIGIHTLGTAQANPSDHLKNE